ncbi:MAG TPA: RICIN domain-containing protein [Pirellulales bacterium]
MFRVTVVFALMLATGIAWGQEDGQVYRIKNRLTDKVLAPDASGKLLVQQTGDPKAAAQQWRLVKSAEGNFFKIVNVESGRALAVPSKQPVAQIELHATTDDKPHVRQWWSIAKLEKRFTIESQFSGYYLDVFNWETEDGVKIVQQELNKKGDRGNQVWELHPVK